MNTKTNNELVAEIHEAFYSADERLLQQAKDLLANPRLDKAIYAERLGALGFGSAKPVKEAIAIAENHLKAGDLIKGIEHWRMYYPGNKFITEEEVKRICEKYGLLLGDAANYTGDVPEKNLCEIEAFKLRKEDYTEKSRGWGGLLEAMTLNWFGQTGNEIRLISTKSRRTGVLSQYFDRVNGEMSGLPKSIGMITEPLIGGGWAIGYDPYGGPKKEEKAAEKEQASFKICAPKQDFNTLGYVEVDGYRLVYDPVVLQPVKDGYLIVTAWGQEASDEIVVNQINN
jgi:hypothetical protein